MFIAKVKGVVTNRISKVLCPKPLSFSFSHNILSLEQGIADTPILLVKANFVPTEGDALAMSQARMHFSSIHCSCLIWYQQYLFVSMAFL